MSYTDKSKTYPHQLVQTPYEPIKRHVRDLVYNIKTPQNAITGSYIDKKCPFTGDVKVHSSGLRGGLVLKMKNEKTIVVKKNYLHFVKKYKRFERRNTKYNVHLSPAFFGLVHVGDVVNCVRTRPMSKTKHYAVVEVMKNANNEVKTLE